MKLQMLLGQTLVLLLTAANAWAQQQPAVQVTPVLKTGTTATGQKLEYPKQSPQVTVTLVEVPPGIEVPWHEHPNLRYVYVIDGTLTIEFENGIRNEFPAGTMFVEAVRTRHRGLNAGPAPVRVLFIDHSEEGQSNVVMTQAPPALREGQGERR